MYHVENILSLARIHELLHSDAAREVAVTTARAILVSELDHEVVDHGLATLGPLDKEFVVLAAVFRRIIAGIHRQKHERDVHEDGDDALQLLFRDDGCG